MKTILDICLYILENSAGGSHSNIDVTADIRQIVLLLTGGGRGRGGGHQLFDKVGKHSHALTNHSLISSKSIIYYILG